MERIWENGRKVFKRKESVRECLLKLERKEKLATERRGRRKRVSGLRERRSERERERLRERDEEEYEKGLEFNEKGERQKNGEEVERSNKGRCLRAGKETMPGS